MPGVRVDAGDVTPRARILARRFCVAPLGTIGGLRGRYCLGRMGSCGARPARTHDLASGRSFGSRPRGALVFALAWARGDRIAPLLGQTPARHHLGLRSENASRRESSGCFGRPRSRGPVPSRAGPVTAACGAVEREGTTGSHRRVSGDSVAGPRCGRGSLPVRADLQPLRRSGNPETRSAQGHGFGSGTDRSLWTLDSDGYNRSTSLVVAAARGADRPRWGSIARS